MPRGLADVNGSARPDAPDSRTALSAEARGEGASATRRLKLGDSSKASEGVDPVVDVVGRDRGFSRGATSGVLRCRGVLGGDGQTVTNAVNGLD